MADVLDVYTRPDDPRFPQVCLDETSRQLLADVTPPLPVADVSGQPGAVHQPGSVVHSTRYAFDLLRQGKVRVRDLITHRLPPEECRRAYEGAVDRKAEQLGVIFQWSVNSDQLA